MKTKFTLLLLIIGGAFLSGKAQVGQVPNKNFNTWTANTNPDGWCTLDQLLGSDAYMFAAEDQSDKVIGNASLALTTQSVSGQVGPGIVSVGTGYLDPSTYAVTFYGAAFTYRPDTVTVISQYTSNSADSGVMYLDLTSDTGGVLLALQETLPYGDSGTNWKSTSWVLTHKYYSAAMPDTMVLQFVSSPSATPPVGSVLHLNGVYFGYVSIPTALQEELNGLNLSIYPNPASESLNISATQDIAGYTLLMYDMNGRLVSGKILTESKTTINLASFASGTYIYKIADRTGNILKEDKFVVAK